MNLTGANRLMGVEEGRYDGHAHLFQRDLPMVPGRRYTPDYDAGLHEYIGHLLSNGLDGALLVQPSFLGSDNSYLIENLQNADEFSSLVFRGVAVVEQSATMDELKQLDQVGIVGMRLNLFMRESTFDPDLWQHVLRAADQLGWHVELHARGIYLPDLLHDLLKTNQTIVVDHFGLPDLAAGDVCDGFQAICKAPKGRILVKVSAPYRVCPLAKNGELATVVQPWFDRLVNHLGTENLAWGSDWPHTQHKNCFTFAEVVEWRDRWLAAVETNTRP